MLETVVLLFQAPLGQQRLFPAAFQFPTYQAILRLDRLVLPCGAVGFLTHDGGLDTAIVIRAAYVSDGVASVRAGAGVVLDSNPESEAEETRHKAAAVLQALGAGVPS